MAENELLPTLGISLVMEEGELSRNEPDDRMASRKGALKSASVTVNGFTCGLIREQSGLAKQGFTKQFFSNLLEEQLKFKKQNLCLKYASAVTEAVSILCS